MNTTANKPSKEGEIKQNKNKQGEEESITEILHKKSMEARQNRLRK